MDDYKLVCKPRKKYKSNKVRFPPLLDLNYRKPRRKKHVEHNNNTDDSNTICKIVPIRKKKSVKISEDDNNSIYPTIGGNIFPNIGDKLKTKPKVNRKFNLFGIPFEYSYENEPHIISRNDLATMGEAEPEILVKPFKTLPLKPKIFKKIEYK